MGFMVYGCGRGCGSGTELWLWLSWLVVVVAGGEGL